jgi:hypothetical protein
MLRTSAWASRKPQSDRQTGTHQHCGHRPDSRPGNATLLRNRAVGVHVTFTQALRHPNGCSVPWRRAPATNVGSRPHDQYNDSDKQAQQQSEKQTDKAPTLPCDHGKRIDEVSSREKATDLGRRNIGIGSIRSPCLPFPLRLFRVQQRSVLADACQGVEPSGTSRAMAHAASAGLESAREKRCGDATAGACFGRRT